MDVSSGVVQTFEAVEVIRLLWSTVEPVDFDGDFFMLCDAILGVSGHAGRSPKLRMPAHRPGVLRAVGRLADAWILILVDPAEYGRLSGPGCA